MMVDSEGRHEMLRHVDSSANDPTMRAHGSFGGALSRRHDDGHV
jgi:hypothetical protein